jgi:hypothetical protein
MTHFYHLITKDERRFNRDFRIALALNMQAKSVSPHGYVCLGRAQGCSLQGVLADHPDDLSTIRLDHTTNFFARIWHAGSALFHDPYFSHSHELIFWATVQRL